MNKDFPRIITHLRKERGLSQKTVAQQLNISQALLSHYEKGIRECGLDFVVRAAEFYDVSCDYLLGRTADRQGATLSISENEEPVLNEEGKSNGNTILTVLNKKLITGTLNVVFDLFLKINNKKLTKHLSMYLMVALYKVFRTVFSIGSKNQQTAFSVNEELYSGYCDSVMHLSYTKAVADIHNPKNNIVGVELSSNIISKDYPTHSSSLLNLVRHSEKLINMKTK